MKDIDTLLDLPYTRLRWIEAGTFLFQDKVKITFEKGFYAGCYQVTQELYEKVTGENPSHFKGKHRPVEYVTWNDAQQFLQQLNEQVKLNDGLQFRLPSETQWEYAARANQKNEYSGSQKLHEVGWFKENSNGQTMPVGLKEPNIFGLYDMNGNVWEWCEDHWSEDIHKIPLQESALKEAGTALRILRGGAWSRNRYDVHVFSRYRNPRNGWNNFSSVRAFRY